MDVQYFKLFLGILYCNFLQLFLFYMQLFTATFIKYVTKYKCDLKRHELGSTTLDRKHV